MRWLFRPLREVLLHSGGYSVFFCDCIRSAVTHGVRWDRLMEESYRLGVRAFFVLATMAIFVGTNLAIQGHASFAPLGA